MSDEIVGLDEDICIYGDDDKTSPIVPSTATRAVPRHNQESGRFDMEHLEMLLLDGADQSSDVASDVEFQEEHGLVVDHFPGAAKTLGVGEHLFQLIPQHLNQYHPFTSKSEWDLAKWLMSSGITVSSIQEFLRLDYVRGYLRRANHF